MERRNISIHKALAGLDAVQVTAWDNKLIFQSTRPSRASTIVHQRRICYFAFQSTRPSRASTGLSPLLCLTYPFQSTRPSRASTSELPVYLRAGLYFNPQGPRGPRHVSPVFCIDKSINFNPQGPRGPRRRRWYAIFRRDGFQSTRPSRASTEFE